MDFHIIRASWWFNWLEIITVFIALVPFLWSTGKKLYEWEKYGELDWLTTIVGIAAVMVLSYWAGCWIIHRVYSQVPNNATTNPKPYPMKRRKPTASISFTIEPIYSTKHENNLNQPVKTRRIKMPSYMELSNDTKIKK